MIGIDTSALIDLFKGDEHLMELLDGMEEEVFVNQISHLEIFLGLNPEDKSHKEEEVFYDRLFSGFECLNIDFNSNKRARDIFWKLKREGALIEGLDCAIAGIYLSNGVNKIITKNKKHFERIKGLKVFSY